MQEILKFENVDLTYHTPNEYTCALEKMSFTVSDHEFLSIVGPSGCGKSSVLSLICGLMEPSGGQIELLGEKITKTNSAVGYMLQRDNLLEWRSVWQNIILGFQIKKICSDENFDYARQLLKEYGLFDFINHYPNQLSGGMRQKVALIRTLAVKPELLLLDEPFSALDYQTRLSISSEISQIIREQNKTAILVTHDIAEAISMADRVLVFSERPAKVQREIILEFDDIEVMKRRNAENFKHYFDIIWKEFNDHA